MTRKSVHVGVAGGFPQNVTRTIHRVAQQRGKTVLVKTQTVLPPPRQPPTGSLGNSVSYTNLELPYCSSIEQELY